MQFHRIRNGHHQMLIQQINSQPPLERQFGCRTARNTDAKYSKVLTLSADFPYKNGNQRFNCAPGMSTFQAVSLDWCQEIAEL